MNLAYLSLYHCPRGAVPPAPTNEDRRRIWRDLQPVELVNAYPWEFRVREEYARNAQPEELF